MEPASGQKGVVACLLGAELAHCVSGFSSCFLPLTISCVCLHCSRLPAPLSWCHFVSTFDSGDIQRPSAARRDWVARAFQVLELVPAKMPPAGS